MPPTPTPRRLTIRNSHARAVFYPERGRFDVVSSGGAGGAGVGLFGVTAGVELTAGRGRGAGEGAGEGEGEVLTLAGGSLVDFDSSGGRIRTTYRCRGLELEFSISASGRPGGFIIELALVNRSRRALGVAALLPICSDGGGGGGGWGWGALEAGLSPRSLRIYRHGWHSCGVTRVVGLMEPHMESAVEGAFSGPSADVEVRGLVRSSGMTQLRLRGAYMTVGFLRQARQFGLLSSAVREETGSIVFSAAALADGKPIAPKGRYASEGLYVGFSRNYADGLFDYASLAGEHSKARRFPEVPIGWCSQACYGEAVTEKRLLRNLGWIERRRRELPFNLFQIDGGWQRECGDWLEANERFPGGMKALADSVKAAGLVPGLWFAPFAISRESRVYREHPDWVVRDGDGLPVEPGGGVGGGGEGGEGGGGLYALDLTNPKVLGHVAQATSRICWDWGFDFIKADHLYFGALAGHGASDTKTCAQNLRRGLEVIRQVAGEDKYILGSRCPPGPAAGVVDGLGVGPPSWALTRFWSNGLLWQNASDCVVLSDRSGKPAGAEGQTLLNAAILSGGLLMLSNDLARLGPGAREMLGKLAGAPTTCAVPLDLYSRKRASVYFAAGKRVLLGVFNWGDSRRTFKIDPRRILGGIPATKERDFWGGAARSIAPGAIEIALPPKASKLFEFV